MASKTVKSSSITFLDMSDQHQLSAYLTSSLSTVQIRTSNDTYIPSWVNPPLTITLHAFVNQSEINYDDTTSYEISWFVKDDGTGTVSEVGNKNSQTLTIVSNDLASSTSGMLTYICEVKQRDTNAVVVTQMTYTLINESKPEKSVVFSLYAPNGTVFVNQSGDLAIATNKYYGADVINSENATFKWYKLDSSGWEEIGGETLDVLIVHGKDVSNMASFKCEMTYPKDGGVTYSDVITIEDKSDIYISEISTIGGTIFKNGKGGSAAYVTVRANGNIVDSFSAIGETAPSGPQNGDYWYCIDENNKKVMLKQYSGQDQVWNTVLEGDECPSNPDDDAVVAEFEKSYSKLTPQKFLYVWYLTDNKGNRKSFANNNMVKYGKVIYMSCDDINEIATLCCDIKAKIQ